ncbi:type I polyketide synthase [Kitasatospora sp. NPDC005856]|uniref:type I polyketide synthase n=1 Tax=Kitasatospora sp. NPDC005856 TaxID=3154566 RepID=UPI0033E73527
MLKSAEPVAVVGMSCRLPGGISSPEALWRLLESGGDAVSRMPEERWRDYRARGARADGVLRRTTRWGGFLDDVAGFDADFFGISPREARAMDPQQRLLLEVAWEALERSGIAPRALAGSDTGVFVGAWSDDYGRRLLEDLPGIQAWTGIGTTLGGVAARLSYHLDLCGPSIAFDTACSSSLVAVHQACQSLRRGESRVALAAGVNLVLSPGLTVNFEQAGALSDSGRCRAFDADADGYVRSEGCGVVVLKLLSAAVADGDRVLALLRGSAVTQNGHGAGIMAPSGAAQARTIRLACADAAVAPGTIDYVEAHGTGTPAGDPAEAAGIGEALGSHRAADDPVLVGSVKTNIGHTESAAGVLGLIKVVLALGHRLLPPTLHYRRPNPAIPMEELRLRVVAEPTPWPGGPGPRRAGVSSYGFGGTNAHLVVEEAPQVAPTGGPAAPGGVLAFPWSGATESSRSAAADRLADWLEDAGRSAELDDVADTLATRRSAAATRAVAVAQERGELLAALHAQAADTADAGLVTGRVLPDLGAGPVWVFSGHGSQWTGMARDLLTEEPVFAAVIDELDPVFEAEAGFSLRAFLTERDAALADVEQVQPVIYGVQVALAELWHAHGLRPAAVIGHSVGEIAAAVAAGILTRTDGARLVCRRSALLRKVAGQGAMALVTLPAEEVRRELAAVPVLDVTVAIRASTRSTVVAGTPAAVAAAVAHWSAAGVLARPVASDVAFHGPQMDPLLADLAAAVADIPSAAARRPMYSTSQPEPRGAHVLDGAYWVGNLRGEVRLEAAVRAAAEDGYRVFVELSSHPVVVHSVRETLDDAGIAGTCVVGTLRRGVPGRRAFLRAAAELHCHGVPVDLTGARGTGGRADVPTTAWEHRPYWTDAPAESGGAAGHDPDSGTLLGAEVLPAGDHLPARVWRTRLGADTLPGRPVDRSGAVAAEPATGHAGPAVLLATLLAAATAAEERGTGAALRLTGVELPAPLPVDAERDVHVVAGEGGLSLFSAVAGGTGPADPHALARGVDVLGEGGEAFPGYAPADVPEGSSDADGGAAFAWRELGRRSADGVLEAEVELCAGADGDSPAGWAGWLDAAVALAADRLPAEDGPYALENMVELTVAGPAPRRALLHVGPAAGDGGSGRLDVTVLAERPGVGLRLAGLGFAAVARAGEPLPAPGEAVLAVEWEPLGQPAAAPGPLARVALIGRDESVLTGVETALRSAGATTLRLAGVDDLATAPGRLTAADAVVLVPGADGAEPGPLTVEGIVLAAGETVGALRALAQWPSGSAPRLWCVTGAWDDAGHEPVGQHALRGLSRVAAGEHPDLWGGLVHRDAVTGADRVGLDLVRVLTGGHGEQVLRLSADGPLRPRLAPAGPIPAGGRGAVPRCDPEGTYLITGGLGALGLRFAEQLVRQGARRLVLVGRRQLPPRSRWEDVTDPLVRDQVARVRRLERAGATVRTVALDIADEAAAREALDPDTLGLPPIRGVLHTAGVIHGGTLRDLDEDALRAELRPKAEGAVVLHRLFPPGSVDFFVLFSAVAAQLGLAGQGGYATANAFLDALAEHRRAAGCPGTLSVAWPAWHGTGLAASAGALESEFAAVGVTDLTEGQAMAAWAEARRREPAHLVVLPVDRSGPPARRLPLLERLFATAADDVPASPAERYRDPGQPGGVAADLVLAEVAGIVAAELGLAVGALDRSRPMAELGMESIMALAVWRRLEQAFGLALPATLLWNHPTAQALATRLAELLAPAPGEPAAAATGSGEEPPDAGLALPDEGFDALLGEFEDDPWDERQQDGPGAGSAAGAAEGTVRPGDDMNDTTGGRA